MVGVSGLDRLVYTEEEVCRRHTVVLCSDKGSCDDMSETGGWLFSNHGRKSGR